MSVTLYIHKIHRTFTNGLETVEVEGDTIGKCLDNLIALFPGMYTALFRAPNRLKSEIEIYHNTDTAYPDELSRKVSSGDEIHITVMLAGG